MKPATAIKLGRVSNLPTIWTNVLAGAALASLWPGYGTFLLLITSISIFYISGMFLNDAFDVNHDTLFRPDRPIPSGDAKQSQVFIAGFVGLFLGVGILFLLSQFTTHRSPLAWLLGILLAGVIVLYDWKHKDNPAAPFAMGFARGLVYLIAASGAAQFLTPKIFLGALALTCYVIGLTMIAKQETLAKLQNLWMMIFLMIPLFFLAPDAIANNTAGFFTLVFLGWTLISLFWLMQTKFRSVGRAVVSLIAGICLFDAAVLSGNGHPTAAIAAVALFAITLILQRVIKGN